MQLLRQLPTPAIHPARQTLASLQARLPVRALFFKPGRVLRAEAMVAMAVDQVHFTETIVVSLLRQRGLQRGRFIALGHEVQLARRGCAPAGGGQHMGQKARIVGRVAADHARPRCRGPAAAEQGGAAGCAGRLGDHALREAGAGGGQSADLWRANDRIAHAGERIGAQLVTDDQQDVGQPQHHPQSWPSLSQARLKRASARESSESWPSGLPRSKAQSIVPSGLTASAL